MLNRQRQQSRRSLLIIGELGFVPLSPTGAELLFEVFRQRYESGSILVTTGLPFDEWTAVFGAKRLTGALLDRLTPHVHILEMNGRASASSAAGRVPHRKLRMDRRRLTSPTLSTRPLASSTALPSMPSIIIPVAQLLAALDRPSTVST